LRRPELQQDRGEPLLRAVVQVTLDAAPGLIAATIVPAILLPRPHRADRPSAAHEQTMGATTT
jgi:hypothetical protein